LIYAVDRDCFEGADFESWRPVLDLIRERGALNPRDYPRVSDFIPDNAFMNPRIFEYLAQCGYDFTSKDTRGNDALMQLYLLKTEVSVVRILHELGCEIDQPNNGGETVLHRAALCNRPDIAEYALANGADPNRRDRRGRTPKDIAVQNGHAEVAQTLSGGN